MTTPNDDDERVDPYNAANVRYWAEKLELTEASLGVLMEIHGFRVADLKLAIRRAQEAAEVRRTL